LVDDGVGGILHLGWHDLDEVFDIVKQELDFSPPCQAGQPAGDILQVGMGIGKRHN